MGSRLKCDQAHRELLDTTEQIVEDATPGNETEGKPPPFFKEGDGGAAVSRMWHKSPSGDMQEKDLACLLTDSKFFANSLFFL